MIWYYDSDEEFNLYDIYNNLVYWRGKLLHPFRLESKNRYSGLLYDKLKYLLDYIHRDMRYYPIGGVGDVLYYYTFRLVTISNYKIIKETSTNYVTGSRPITTSIFFDYIHFIEC